MPSPEGRHTYAPPGGLIVPDVPPWGLESPEETGVLRHGGLSIDVEGRTATYTGTELPLTKIEFDLLATMIGNPRRVWRRETLLNIVWGGQWPDHHVVEVHIGNLRRKLADVAGAGVPIIKTVRGIGYRMAPTDPARPAGHHAGLPATY
jgi:DNA-binding response OmpR family regulator